MVTGLTIVALVAVSVVSWFTGTWNSILTCINIFLAGIIATCWYQPLVGLIDDGENTFIFLLDFISVWSLFIVSFTVLRVASHLLSKTRVEFDIVFDRIARTVFAAGAGWAFICFMLFAMHMAPIPPDSFQEKMETVNFPGSPDGMWLGFMRYASTSGMAAPLEEWLAPEYRVSSETAEGQAFVDRNCRAFDSREWFVKNNQLRRRSIERNSTLRVRRQ